MIVPVDQLGAVGLVADTAPQELAANAWTYARNVRFLGESISKGPGYERVGSFAQPSFLVYGLFSVIDGATQYWVAAGLTQVASFQGTTWTDITGSTVPSGAATDAWNGGMLNGVLVINNGKDTPQMWDLPGAASALADLTGWDANWTAKVIRPFKNYLVALDLTKSSVRDKRLVKWSHTAAPLTVPTSWDEADPTVDAGEVSLAEGNDALVDCLPLSNSNIVYTEDQTWAMTLSGNNQIFNFRLLFPESGLLTQGCVCAFRQGGGQPIRHFCVTKDDFVVHDGSTLASVGDKRVRRLFFDALTSTSKPNVRVVNCSANQEVWVSYTDGGGSTNPLLLAWNYQYNTWSIYNVPNHRAITVHDGNDRVVLGEHSGRWLTEVSNAFATQVGGSMQSEIKRLQMPLKGAAQGQLILDHSRKAMVTRYWPKITASSNLGFTFQLAVTDDRDEDPNFTISDTFTVGGARPVDRVTPPYRYLSLYVLQSSTATWKLDGIDWEISAVGKF